MKPKRAEARHRERPSALEPRARLVLLVLALLVPALAEASVPRAGALERETLAFASLAGPALAGASRDVTSLRSLTTALTPDSLAVNGFSLFEGDELAQALDQGEHLDVDGSGRVLASRANELRLELHGELEPLAVEPLRGPPGSYPKTRIGGLELSEPFREGGEQRLSLGLQWGCEGISCQLASDQRKDPLGLMGVGGCGFWCSLGAFWKGVGTVAAAPGVLTYNLTGAVLYENTPAGHRERYSEQAEATRRMAGALRDDPVGFVVQGVAGPVRQVNAAIESGDVAGASEGLGNLTGQIATVRGGASGASATFVPSPALAATSNVFAQGGGALVMTAPANLGGAALMMAANTANQSSSSSGQKGSLPDWLKKRFQEGEDFNRQNRARYPYNEVEVAGTNGETFRVDSFDPAKGEIVSRKFTQLADVKQSTAVGYLNELGAKYPADATITHSPFNPKILRGQRLRGTQILEVPAQKAPVPQAVLDAASKRGVVIRDVAGKVY